MKCITKVMNRNAKANMFAFNHTRLHYTKFADNQTIKQPKKKCKLAFKGTYVKKQKTLFY